MNAQGTAHRERQDKSSGVILGFVIQGDSNSPGPVGYVYDGSRPAVGLPGFLERHPDTRDGQVLAEYDRIRNPRTFQVSSKKRIQEVRTIHGGDKTGAVHGRAVATEFQGGDLGRPGHIELL